MKLPGFLRRDRGPASEAPAGAEGIDTPSAALERPPDEPIPGDRGIPSVNRVRSLQSRVSSILALALMSTLGLGMLAWYYGRALSHSSQSQERAQALSRSRAQGEMQLPPLGTLTPPTQEPAAAFAVDVPPSSPAPAVPPQRNRPGGKTQGDLAFERRMKGPAFARQGGTAAAATSVAMADDGLPAAVSEGGSLPPTEPSAGNNGSALNALLRPTATRAVSAQLLPTRRLLLPKGAFIDCTLETAIDSSLPGMTTCTTATDTFSADGMVVLLERGTKLVGETRGEVRRGSTRIFVLWTEARTPTGVVVPIASPGTDELGRSGLSGEVNRHFWERFGAAILVSVIDSAVQSAVQNRGGSDTFIYNPGRTSDIFTEVLRGTIDIPPTVVKSQGDRIQVFVARDVDFRSVYELRALPGR